LHKGFKEQKISSAMELA